VDLKRIVAAGDDYETMRAAALEAGFPRVVVEWLPPLDRARSSGGA
jgi:hypothetical protein